MTLAAIIVAGGSGTRFGDAGGKQTIEVCGRPLFAWSVEAFSRVPEVAEIVVVAPSERLSEFRLIAERAAGRSVVMAPSGEQRQDSVAFGLEALSSEPETVAVHDGARPLVTPTLIEAANEALLRRPEADGLVVAHPSVDTVKVVDGDTVVETPDRASLWAVQTPQIFWTKRLARAYARAREDGFCGTDDASLVERLGGTVVAFHGPRDNIKVTLPEDVTFVEAVLRARGEGCVT